MRWLGKNTAWYHLATHNKDNIVEAFDPVTWKVRKDDKGNLKIQMVADWPVNACLSRSKVHRISLSGPLILIITTQKLQARHSGSNVTQRSVTKLKLMTSGSVG